jgi:hypothetical protein
LGNNNILSEVNPGLWRLFECPTRQM